MYFKAEINTPQGGKGFLEKIYYLPFMLPDEEFKLNRHDVGWYHVRKTLERRNEQGNDIPVSFEEFKNAYDALTEKLRLLVYEYGFLRE